MKKDTLKLRLKAITIPIFIEMALVMMLGISDTLMLSRYSDNSVAAVGVDNQIVTLIFLIYQFFSVGTSVLCSQYVGAGLRKQFVQAVGVAIVLNLGIGIAVSILLCANAESMLHLMGLRPDLMPDALAYLRITGAFSFFQALSLAFSASLRSTEKAKYPMMVTAAGNVLNIIGNYVLIFGHFGLPRLGAEGAAITTAVCRALSALALYVIHSRVQVSHFPLHYFRPFPWHQVSRLMRIGVPAMTEKISYCLSQIAITYFINHISNEALAARSYCASIITFVFLFCNSITHGGNVLIGHLVGQQRQRAAYILGNRVFRTAMTVTLLCSVALALSGHAVLSHFTQNEQIITLGCYVFAIDTILEIGRVCNIFSTSTLSATGDTIYPVVVGVLFQWAIAVALSYVVGIYAGLGLVGMWAVFALDEHVRGFILMRRWHSGKWKTMGFVKKRQECTSESAVPSHAASEPSHMTRRVYIPQTLSACKG